MGHTSQSRDATSYSRKTLVGPFPWKKVGFGLSSNTPGLRISVALTPTDIQRLVSALDDLIIPPTSSLRAPFAPKYRVAISLLNEDSSLGGFVQNWDIERAIQRKFLLPFRSSHPGLSKAMRKGYLRPLLDEVSVLYNFTIESHVQYHAPLAFEPPSVTLENRMIFELDQDQLKTFVNSAEWTLGECDCPASCGIGQSVN